MYALLCSARHAGSRPRFRGGAGARSARIQDVLALDVRHGLPTALSAAVTVALIGIGSGSPGRASPAMPAPGPESVEISEQTTAQIGCEDPAVQTVVFTGRVHALDPDLYATFNFRFADLPERYVVVTGAHGDFEVRVSRKELGLLDLCSLPLAGDRAAQFADAQLSITYHLSFER